MLYSALARLLALLFDLIVTVSRSDHDKDVEFVRHEVV